jgi:uncharacterized protein (TIGR04255 family)
MKEDIRFATPPIIELICGIQFTLDPLAGKFDFTVFNDFYAAIKESFPTIEENPPVPLVFDKVHAHLAELVKQNPFSPRYFFVNEADNKLIQLQAGKFLFNWRKNPNSPADYPEFENVYQECQHNWNIFERILQAHQISYEINQLELIYIDHIYPDDLGDAYRDASSLFRFLGNGELLKDSDGINVTVGIPQPHLRGHLSCQLSSALRNDDQKKLFLLHTTVRGLFPETHRDLDEWFTNAHQAAIHYFFDSITESAQKAWRPTI